ncbi:family 16 glycoside hydrolase [Pseudochryseolinea flava]|uniref:PA14 domain-containing protein n=1 Tax=Pseudochryseolinea flava TaxID=2059302 RepID=A0A364YBA9_9BACT|nr:family 16 glycoside hydrolase [Pseudochryseolinea flava]RAW03382.1 hypothetical protein DQQ10_04660 [Pseudochryseolinea flava]
MKKKSILFSLMLFSAAVAAQETPVKTLPFNDMSSFKPQAGNWQVVGDVVMDRNVDSHPVAKSIEQTSPGKKKKGKEATPPPAPKAVSFQPGTGILLNMNDDTHKDNLVSAFEHGDIELEFEVMLPKGSNSGIYLQGRYEVQLYDSWGVKEAKFSDIGGIYRNWENKPGKIYMGKAPLSNPAKAPGLWQKMKIVFRAPRFDAAGNKIANAKFVTVSLNDVVIHDNVEVPLPTGGPIENNEKAMGPLMIQGDHGAVAFRNFKYKLTKEISITVSDVTYKTYQGAFKSVDEFASLKPATTGSSPELTAEVIPDENNYGVIYTGKVTVPEDAEYEFYLAVTGGLKFVVNNQTLVDHQTNSRGRRGQKITLKAGTYPFEIYNFKTSSWMPPRLGWYARTENSYVNTLTAYNSFPPDDEPTSPILIHVGSSPKLLRAFLDFKRNRGQRLTHTIGVGDPSGVNYVYDLGAANLVCVWRGDFVDATPMWHERGDGSFRPLGAVQYLLAGPSLVSLASEAEDFPTTYKEGSYKSKGYSIEESTGRPIFKFSLDGLDVDDKITPDGTIITRELTLKNKGAQPLYFKLAEGTSIIKMADGSYAIDDKQFYIKTDHAATIRESGDKKSLVVKVEGNAVKYTVIW